MCRRHVPWLLALFLVVAQPPQLRAASPDDPARDEFVALVWELIAAVEAEHIDPPSRRELLDAGIQNLAEKAGANLSAWSDAIPDDVEPAAARDFLGKLHETARRHGPDAAIVNAMVAGISHSLPGGAITVDAATARVNDSLAGNRYEGVGVALDFEGARPKILDTFFGGPAHRAGIQPGDIIYEVDGLDTEGMGLERFIDYSRDEVGTELVYVVGQPGSTERRKASLVRSVVPRETAVGTERSEDERWVFALPASASAYVKLTDITASTAFELRRAAEQIGRDGSAGLLLDLRGCRSTQMREAALVADLFRTDATDAVMGASETRARRTEYRAGPDVLFDAESVVVLVDGATRGTPEWLAAVLRQSGASIVGQATAGVPFLLSRVAIPGWPVELRMATGRILEPGAPSPRPMGQVIPDRPVADAARALDEARTLLQG